MVSGLLDATVITKTYAAPDLCYLSRAVCQLISSQEDNRRRERLTQPAALAREHVQLQAVSTDEYKFTRDKGTAHVRPELLQRSFVSDVIISPCAGRSGERREECCCGTPG